MISVIISTHNSEARLPATLTALVPAAVEGIVREVIVADAGSTDRTRQIADHAGAELIPVAGGRGACMSAGARKAKFPWLLFLQPVSVIEEGWERSATEFMRLCDMGEHPPAAAEFRLRLVEKGLVPRARETIEAVRSSIFKRPRAAQGLLISKKLYSELTSAAPGALVDHAHLISRLGRRRIALLDAAVTVPARGLRDC